MLLCISLLVFGMLAWLMPQTYSNKLNTILDERAQGFVSELKQIPFSDSGGLFAQKNLIMNGRVISRNQQLLALAKPLPFYQTITIFLSLIAVTAIRLLCMVRQNIY